MDARASEVLAALKNTNLSIDAKQTYITKLKSDIKRENIPDSSIPLIFEALRIALPSPSLATPAFSTLGHVLKRLYLQQDHRAIAMHGRAIYPFLLDRLGDHREKMRQCAMQAFADFWAASKTDVESYVLEGALVGRNPRAKEASMLWLSKMTREQGLLFRSYVPSLVVCLEDADVGVRETAKSTVIELFQNAPLKAQSDLKKQLQLHSVRKSIVTSILSSIGASFDDFTPAAPSSQGPASKAESTRPGSNHRKERTPSTTEGNLADLVNTELDGENVEPYTVHSHRELDEIFRDMTPHFEGRESEQNWLPREKSVLLLRRITKGNAPLDFSQYYVSGIKSLLDGILKVVNSLRTTVSTAGCILLQEIAQTLGPAIDPWVEILLQNMIKVCSGLKKITSQNGNATVDAIVGNASYTNRIMQHMWFAISDKNVQPRLFATGWLKTIINTHAVAHRGAMEHYGGVDVLEKCIKKGLADANPGVREAMRGTYWVFWKFWRERADEIMEGLDPKSQKLLEKDSGNPNAGQHGNGDAKSRGTGKTSAKNTPARPTLKETIAAQKRARMQAQKAAAAATTTTTTNNNNNNNTATTTSAPGSVNGNGTLSSRPESALSNHSNNTRGTNISTSAPVSTAKPTRPTQGQGRSQGIVSTTATGMAGVSHGGTGLSSAPMRPGARNKQQQQQQHQQQSRPLAADSYDQLTDRDVARSRSRGSSRSPPTQQERFPHEQHQQQSQYHHHQASSSSLRARPHSVIFTPRRTKSRGDLAVDVSTGLRQQENIPPPIPTDGQLQGRADRPRRLDIAVLKAEGKQAQNAAHQTLIAHAGDAGSPTVIMSPAPDDD
ncbi:suppressor of tub2 mutation, partial [Ascosphaera aggregata]